MLRASRGPTMLACYTDRLSVTAGESFRLHASAAADPCTLEIARVAAARRVVSRREGLSVGEHAVPEHVDRDGCGWPAALEVETGADWQSGYYDIQLTDALGEETHHFVCVKAPAPKARAVLVLATTWIREGRAEIVLAAVRAEARARRALAARLLPSATGPAESLHVWLPLPPDVSPERFRLAAQRRGLALVTQEAFAVDPAAPAGMRLSLGGPGRRQVLEGALGNLAELLAASARGRPAV